MGPPKTAQWNRGCYAKPLFGLGQLALPPPSVVATGTAEESRLLCQQLVRTWGIGIADAHCGGLGGSRSQETFFLLS